MSQYAYYKADISSPLVAEEGALISPFKWYLKAIYYGTSNDIFSILSAPSS